MNYKITIFVLSNQIAAFVFSNFSLVFLYMLKFFACCGSKSYVVICNYSINIVQWLVGLYIIKMHGTAVEISFSLFTDHHQT